VRAQGPGETDLSGRQRFDFERQDPFGSRPSSSGNELLTTQRPVQATDQPARPIQLREAIGIALSRSDVVRVLNGGVRIAPITGYDTQISETTVTGEMGAFDPRLKAAYESARIDNPPSSFFGPGIATETLRRELDVSAEISRKWSTGTTTSFGYAPPLAYLYFPRAQSGLNPAYSAEFLLTVEQPLLRGAWKPVNLAPIHIAQTQVDQTRWETQQTIQQQVRSVEEAYWQLNAAYVELQAVQNVIPLAEETVRIEKLRMQAEQSIYSDVARVEVQLEQLRQRYLDAWIEARRREYQLRQLIGMDVQDGTELLPADAPQQSPPDVDFDNVVEVAMRDRPDLNQRRLGLQIREQELLLAENRTKPQLNASASYRVSGLSDRLNRSFYQVGTFNYEDWTLGMSFSVPLRNRTACSELDASNIRLMRDRALLSAYEKQVVFELAIVVSEVSSTWRQYESAHRQLVMTAQWLRVARVRYANPPDAGERQDWLLLALRDYQSAIDAHVRAVTQAGRSLAQYNILLARLDEQQGINLDRWKIRLNGNGVESPEIGQFSMPGYASIVPIAMRPTGSITSVSAEAGSVLTASEPATDELIPAAGRQLPAFSIQPGYAPLQSLDMVPGTSEFVDSLLQW